MPRPRSRTKAEAKAAAKLMGAGCPVLPEGSERTYCGVTVQDVG